MADSAYTSGAKTPSVPGTQGLYFRVYGVTPDGQTYDLPPERRPKNGECHVPRCTCGGVQVEDE
jgi:hypothetical protein